MFVLTDSCKNEEGFKQQLHRRPKITVTLEKKDNFLNVRITANNRINFKSSWNRNAKRLRLLLTLPENVCRKIFRFGENIELRSLMISGRTQKILPMLDDDCFIRVPEEFCLKRTVRTTNLHSPL
ncbi:unnamed protein product, partial [Nesidiocoris tenuis]